MPLLGLKIQPHTRAVCERDVFIEVLMRRVQLQRRI